MKTFDEILDEHKIVRYRETFKRVMKTTASQAVRMALEEAARKATASVFTAEYGAYTGHEIDKESILSLESEILAKLK